MSAPDRRHQSDTDTDSLRAERGETPPESSSGALAGPVGSADGPSLGAMLRGPVADEVLPPDDDTGRPDVETDRRDHGS